MGGRFKTALQAILTAVLAFSVLLIPLGREANAKSLASNASDDAWMWGTTFMGSSTTGLNVYGAQDKKAYLKFTVSGAGTITDAILKVKCVTGGTATVGAYAGTGNNSWTESNLAWNNRPDVGSLLDSKSTTFVAGTVYSFHVGSLLSANGTYSIILKSTSGDEVVFSSKEGSSAPQLIVSDGTTPVSSEGPSLAGYTLYRDYSFGTSRNVNSLTSLANSFNAYGIAGTTVINHEWQRYQPINANNHVLTANTLDLTALANLGGVYDGGISSGQIATKETFYPSDGKTYIFQLRAKIPNGTGTWPAFWLYSPGGTGTTASEIDIFEFFNSPTQNQYDWTGYDHGSGVGDNYYNIMTNQWVWHPGTDFSADYHLYTLVWKEGEIQKWVDGTLVKGTNFNWFGPAPQVLIDLAIGGDPNSNPTTSTFPAKFSLDYFRVYVKN
ncbi:glycoside hydrolase family 16 protein [Cohnella zeiphila]|uniref:Glycoside hydrolase family 16 protein n=1 Tax=Cohnella zeiphila TaxID=2761120 RepID=A0A7X0VYQ6_9BACL|nr:glycoside hydrolase family 16 protein [Cohnella zeiphila]MBB6735261.1 glycoside hydrolase family 16 protein [Cohnella zeiphila]